MNVTLAGAFPPQQKGEAHYLGEYAKALSRCDGVELSVVSQYDAQPSVESWNGITVSRAVRDRTRRMSFAPQNELVSAVLNSRPDILHVQYGPNADYGGRLGEPLVSALRRVRRAGIPVVLTLHSLWMPDDVLGSPAAKKIPSVIRPLLVPYFGRLMRGLRDATDVFACLVSGGNSPVTRAFSSAYRLSDISEEVHGCVPRFKAISDEDPLVFSFGFLREDKGFHFLLRAFRQHLRKGGAGRLLIAGRPQTAADDSYVEHLCALARQMPADRCTVRVGFVPDEELEAHLSASAVVVLPYLRNVGASGPLHHAIGAGRPVIATSVGHNAALSGHIILTEPGNAEQLEVELSELLSNTRKLRDAAEAVRLQAQLRSWDALASQYLNTYSRLLSKSKGSKR